VVLTDIAADPMVDDLGAFVRAYHQHAVRAVTVACGSPAVAEEAVQEALAKAWARRSRHPRPDSMLAWVIAVAINETRSRGRRAVREARAYSRVARPPDAVETQEQVDLRRALDALPLRQRQCVVLHYLLGYDIASISAALGVSSGTVKSALHRARAALASALRAGESDDER
jgi:RNA polymerase sigma-70 factor, ECF subfamily